MIRTGILFAGLLAVGVPLGAQSAADAAPVRAQHWAFRELKRPPVPKVADDDWSLGPIDRFLAVRYQAEGIDPSPDADAITLVRRLHLDLTGMPPSPAEVDAFLTDAGPDRIARRIDSLIGTTRYAERMAVWWLDLVRYADTVGYHGDQEHAISPYRDYVLKAFRDNYRFDRFTREQLAGDLLPKPSTEQRVASAYNRVLQTTHEGGAQPGEYLAKYAADRVRNLSQVWLGATLGCAECHDHKYDPYTQRDFYRMAAFFADIDEEKGFGAPNTTPTRRPPEIDVPGLLDAAGAPRRKVMVTVAKEPRITRVLRRGNWMDAEGEIVRPGVPACLPQLPGDGDRATRLELASWLTSPQQPLAARVTVNRLWALFFGRGISASLDDDGVRGELPTHPELLDWLACELVDSGWDIAHVIRAIVSSHAYRQSSSLRDDLRESDPDGKLVARQHEWRLPAEFVRDTLLAAAGLLVERFGGPSAHPYQPAGYYAHLNFPEREYRSDVDDGQYRRGVYVHWQRMFLHPMLRAFDAPTREECTASRSRSNTPLQALTLLDDPSFVEAARVFAAQVLSDRALDDDARISLAWLRALSRPPSRAESAVLRELLMGQRAAYRAAPDDARALLRVGLAPLPNDVEPAELAAWTAVTRAILNLHHTITRS